MPSRDRIHSATVETTEGRAVRQKKHLDGVYLQVYRDDLTTHIHEGSFWACSGAACAKELDVPRWLRTHVMPE